MAPRLKAAQYEPSSPQERIEGLSILLPLDSRNGFVFLLAKTQKSNADSELLFQTLSEQAHRLVTTFGKDANPQHRFEQFLGALNETLAQQVREGRWNVPIDQFDAVVGIAAGNLMYISGTGDLTALFFHKKPSSRFQIFNLFRSIQTEQTLPTWEKPFAVVLDGDLHNGDVFCVSNKDLQREIDTEELNTILTTLPPSSSIQQVRQYFSHKDSMLLFVLRVGERKGDIKEGYAKPLADLSVEKMVSSEGKTDSLLEDQKPKIGKVIIWIFEKVFRKKGASRLLKDLRKDQPKWKIGLHAVQIVGHSALKSGKYLAQKGGRAAMDLSKKENRDKTMKKAMNVGRELGRSPQGIKERLTGLPRSTQYMIIGAIVAVLVLGISISILSKSQAKSAQLKAYNEEVLKIENLIERAAGAVIYKDENQARSLYVNAMSLVDELPAVTEEQQQKAAEFSLDIDTAMDELRHMVTIPNPALLADLGNLNDGLYGSALVRDGSDYYVFASDARVYKLDRTQKVFNVAGTVPEGSIDQSISAASDEGKIYGLGAQKTVVQFKPSDLSQTVLNLPDAKSWVDMVAYANRLYLLEPTERGEGQIYRYGRTGDNFGSPSKWIEAKTTDLNNAVSLTIDGTIFVLKNDGTIIRYVSGSEVGWDAGVVDPPVTAATDIWTDPNSDFLYVLEPETNRLVIFNKDSGEFVVQYRSDAFQELSDFAVDEAGYSIYLLSGSKLYSIAASHVE